MDLREAVALLRALVARLGQRRRLVAAAFAGVAMLAALHVLRPAPPATTAVWVAARALPGGEPIVASDLAIERLPAADVPTAAVRSSAQVIGRLLATPLTRGEPLTQVRLLSPSLLDATDAAGDVAVPVRVADGAATVALVRAGDLVDIIAAPIADSGSADAGTAVVRDVRVLATPSNDPGHTASQSAQDAGLLIVAATSREAAELANAATGESLSVAVRQHP
jgi:pilus assembly protein CpaB